MSADDIVAKTQRISPLARAIKRILHSKEHVASNFKSAPDNRYFEDYVPGAVHEFGSTAVDEEEVLEFGKRYVPLLVSHRQRGGKTQHLRRP